MAKERIEEYALDDGYTLYQETSLDVYIFEYPRFNADVSAEITSGSTIASLSTKANVPHGYTITTAKTDNLFTVKAFDSEKIASVNADSLRELEHLDRIKAAKVVKKIGEQFGIFKGYNNPDTSFQVFREILS